MSLLRVKSCMWNKQTNIAWVLESSGFSFNFLAHRLWKKTAQSVQTCFLVLLVVFSSEDLPCSATDQLVARSRSPSGTLRKFPPLSLAPLPTLCFKHPHDNPPGFMSLPIQAMTAGIGLSQPAFINKSKTWFFVCLFRVEERSDGGGEPSSFEIYNSASLINNSPPGC